ncbi:MAG: nitronate monooxygenase family protein [Oscillospiraceae bacterium]|nr:nitronate monooxygenase family protein [Oscillospiraceae bacterium]MDY5096460.1 nitronate monooxygenase family protein [Oscillospiraceae bacterium]
MKLGNRELALPLIQGGMGVGVSMGGLAGAVAAEGAMGTLSTADAGWNEPDFAAHPQQANLRALRREVQRAKRLAAGAGLVAVNAMVATRQYADSVRTALEAGADAIVSGAGLPLELPALAEGFEALLAPIVSGPRAAQLICRTWAKRYGRVPDFVVLEGCQAGGHLGFEEADLLSGRCAPLSRLIPEVLAALRPFEEKFGRAIPLFCAGGVATGAEMARCTRLGAAGAQLATRFIATEECDAGQGYKDVLLAARPEDLRIIHSPVGMPGRAVNSPLVQRLAAGMRQPPAHCSGCIKSCRPAETPFCITHALIEAVKGNWEEGLFFSGSRVDLVDRMRTVPDLIDELMKEWRALA